MFETLFRESRTIYDVFKLNKTPFLFTYHRDRLKNTKTILLLKCDITRTYVSIPAKTKEQHHRNSRGSYCVAGLL